MMKKVFAVLIVFAFFIFGTNLISYATEEKISSEILIDGNTGQVLYENNSDKPIHIGSLNKLMTVFIVAECVESGELSLNDELTAGNNAFNETGAVIWLETGEKMSVSDLLKGIIIGNANDACIVFAEEISGSEKDFVKLMNQKAKELGMKNTVFTDCKGTGSGNQYSTAYDMSLLTKELIEYDFLIPHMTTYIDELRNGATQLVNINTLVRNYDGILGVKAGYSEKSGYSLSAAAKRGDSVFISIVIGCDEKEDCIKKGKSLLDKGFSSYETIRPAVPKELMSGVKVKNGTTKNILVKPEILSETIIPIDCSDDIEYKIILPECIEAPILKNQKIGEISYYLYDNEIYKTNIIASESVEKMTFFNALLILLKSTISF
ncbi:MAG: D-alanyl-D-alanine carboxypeptidase [Oscillospiraceae bacterium]|nr:D-alanyl-D-alanine carboxypeptidase [Oscillospiraceae bacterium]MBR4093364.1 D-alanyl-D-alanine carboxypeptidase [Oscillospiraceae bacterium]